MYEGAMWGELWATGSRGRRFGPDDVRFLEAIAAQVSVAIGRAELFSEVSRNAYEDPLTRVANRRALDECLRGLEDREGTPTLLVCDLDGLKEVNDRDGHPAGDALLRGVAGVLSDVASAFGRRWSHGWAVTSSASSCRPAHSPTRRGSPAPPAASSRPSSALMSRCAGGRPPAVPRPPPPMS